MLGTHAESVYSLKVVILCSCHAKEHFIVLLSGWLHLYPSRIVLIH